MSPADYQKYLASREWALLKEQLRHRSRGKCERCQRGKHEQAHHVTYERIGNERMDDLLAVCAPCHEFLSGKTNVDPCVAHLAAGMLKSEGGEWMVACPQCGFDYTHVRSSFTRLGEDSTEAAVYDGTEARGTTPWRRSALVVHFDGECGHAWEFEIQQHKGQNFVTCRAIPSRDDESFAAAQAMAQPELAEVTP